jgi:hypothetical protein
LLYFRIRTEGPGFIEDKDAGPPENVHAIKVCYAILDHEPKSVAELIHVATDTRPPLILTFGAPGAERGSVFLGSASAAWPRFGFI